MDTGIYLIECLPTKQGYVGTALHWERRIARHLSKLRRGIHKNKKMQEAWNTYGAINFTFKLLEECEIPQLLEREKFWVAKLDTDYKGFNDARLGSNGFLSHGQTHSRTYKSWDSMKQRCTNKNDPRYHKYGGAGIVVCQRWLDSFEDFYSDMGERPVGHTIDRYPNKHGNYEPTNCRWATPQQQQRNLTNNQYLTFEGQTKLLIDWAAQFGIEVSLLRQRANRGVTGPELFAKSYFAFKGIKDADGQTVTTKRKLKPGKTYTAHGKTLTVAQWAVELGLSESALKQRLEKYKIPPEEALLSGHRQKGKAGPRQGHNMITAFGKTQSLTSWSRELRRPVTTLRNRLYRAKMKPEDALVPSP